MAGNRRLVPVPTRRAASPALDQLKNEIRALLKRDDWQHEDDGFYSRAALGELLMRAREIIEGRRPPTATGRQAQGRGGQGQSELAPPARRL